MDYFYARLSFPIYTAVLLSAHTYASRALTSADCFSADIVRTSNVDYAWPFVGTTLAIKHTLFNLDTTYSPLSFRDFNRLGFVNVVNVVNAVKLSIDGNPSTPHYDYASIKLLKLAITINYLTYIYDKSIGWKPHNNSHA